MCLIARPLPNNHNIPGGGQAVTAVIRANPYDFSADVKDQRLFAGRQSEMGLIREELARLASVGSAAPVVALIGERRVGKTSLLHRISELAAEYDILPCTINMTNVLAATAGEFWYEVFQGLLSSAVDAGAITFDAIRKEIGFRPIQSNQEQRARTQAPTLGLFEWYAYKSQLSNPVVPPTSIVSTEVLQNQLLRVE